MSPPMTDPSAAPSGEERISIEQHIREMLVLVDLPGYPHGLQDPQTLSAGEVGGAGNYLVSLLRQAERHAARTALEATADYCDEQATGFAAVGSPTERLRMWHARAGWLRARAKELR